VESVDPNPDSDPDPQHCFKHLDAGPDPNRDICNEDPYLDLDTANRMKTDPEENIWKNQLLIIWT
jgi:hypothetical protein